MLSGPRRRPRQGRENRGWHVTVHPVEARDRDRDRLPAKCRRHLSAADHARTVGLVRCPGPRPRQRPSRGKRGVSTLVVPHTMRTRHRPWPSPDATGPFSFQPQGGVGDSPTSATTSTLTASSTGHARLRPYVLIPPMSLLPAASHGVADGMAPEGALDGCGARAVRRDTATYSTAEVRPCG